MPSEINSSSAADAEKRTKIPLKAFKLTGHHVFAILIAFFGVIITVNAYFIFVALKTLPGTEVKSPYEESQKFNQGLAAVAEQDKKGWKVDIFLNELRSNAPLVVKIRDKQERAVQGMSVSVWLQRPTDERLDHKLTLKDLGEGLYQAQLPEMLKGVWRVVLEVKLDGQRQFYSETRVMKKE